VNLRDPTWHSQCLSCHAALLGLMVFAGLCVGLYGAGDTRDKEVIRINEWMKIEATILDLTLGFTDLPDWKQV